MIAVMSGVMLTACGSASIAPLDYLTDDIVDINDLPAYPTKPTDLTGSGFLAETADGFNTTDIHDGHESYQITPHWRAGEDSESPDGYASFATGILEYYTYIDRNPDGSIRSEQELPRYPEYNTYYGILSTTDLGAPLTEAPATAIWPGYFGGGRIRRDEITNFYVDFESGQFGFHNGMDGDDSGIGTKDIRFGGGFFGATGTGIHTLNGYFGNHPKATGLNPGQMVGTFTSVWPPSVPFFDYGEATVIGLIGEEGAVGVFTEVGRTEWGGLSGGFTATNPSYTPPVDFSDPCISGVEGACVEYADWKNSFSIPPPTARNTINPANQFLSGDVIALIDGLDAGNLPIAKILNLKDAINRKTHNPAAVGENDNSGVAFFKDDVPSYYYAGLLSGTNLGAPLVEESGNAEWVGRFNYSAQRFTLEIDFANKKVEAFVSYASQEKYHLIGSYNKDGVITGTVNYGRLDADTRKPIAGEPIYPAVLTGLIGQNGAVGVFISGTGDKNGIISGADNFNYAGGFVAHPYGN